MADKSLKIVLPAIIIVIAVFFSIFYVTSDLDSVSNQDNADKTVQSTEESIMENPENMESKREIETTVTINDPGYSEEEIVYDVLNKEIPPGYVDRPFPTFLGLSG